MLPYLKDFYLDAEDAICSAQLFSDKPLFNVVVPVLPRIGNHTDFDALRLHTDINLQFVSIDSVTKNACPPADLIILPGSKNTRADLTSLKKAGWEKHLLKHLRYGGKIIGVCGGYQMLGNTIHDLTGIEDKPGSTEGFAMLDIETTMEANKLLCNSAATFLHPEFANVELQGYEIHCGVTTLSEQQQTRRLLKFNEQNPDEEPFDGAYSEDNKVIGTYMHGLFDHANATKALLKWAGLDTQASIDLDDIREQQLDRLAEAIDQHCQLPAIE